MAMESPVTPFTPVDDFFPEPDIVIEHQRTQSPLRKRPRHTSSITASDSGQSLVMVSEESKAPIRDDTYYMSDGSCILRVQNTLFKVHRTILSKDQSSFGLMFTLPQGEISGEGMSDDHPIVLQGDSAEEFRHFLWALYALPSELMIIQSPISKVDLSRLIDIAKVSCKYSFKSTETWALDAIQEYLERNTSPLFNDNPLIYMFRTSTTRSSALLEGPIARLIRLAQMCSHSRLMDTMIGLLQKLLSGSLHYSYLAMTLADEFNLRDLRGAAYLEVMQTSVFVCSGVANGHTYVEGDIQETSEGPQRLVVSPVQQLRLLSGYHRLSKAWDKLRTVPPQFEHAPSCCATWHQNHGCTQSWTDFWKEKTRLEGVLSLGSANVLGRLAVIIKEFDKWGSATYMYHDCKSAARRSIHEKVKQLQQALPDYFTEGGEY
ncbi:uncharacterized protein EDB93DRAFT_1247449 [Suillus bovinus]|uniref:uncharacterized protein n=1 Tax=Suillus bovinus TaxID=48563 RepID=UPI001B879B36|nr:uncharacterized protein EDB93DRAFT_1247449 [Suillus bovinus]KAG2155803.1 hypothetical protein EDB93DRAFT_1247449 [Suillus bovinus]